MREKLKTIGDVLHTREEEAADLKRVIQVQMQKGNEKAREIDVLKDD